MIYKYSDTSMCVQYENKTSNEIRPDPFISAIRTSFKRILDPIPQERIRLRLVHNNSYVTRGEITIVTNYEEREQKFGFISLLFS